MNPPFAGRKRNPQSCTDPIHSEGRAHSDRVVLIEVFALELQDVSDQQFSILIGHLDEAAMEAIGVERVGDGINAQYFEVGLKEHLVWKEQGAGENRVHLEGLVECDADTAAADVDGPLDKRSLHRVGLVLYADG